MERKRKDREKESEKMEKKEKRKDPFQRKRKRKRKRKFSRAIFCHPTPNSLFFSTPLSLPLYSLDYNVFIKLLQLIVEQ